MTATISYPRALGLGLAAATAAAALAWASSQDNGHEATAQAPRPGAAATNFSVFRGATPRVVPGVPAYRDSLIRHGLAPDETRAAGKHGLLFATASEETICVLAPVDGGTYGSACGAAATVAADGLFSVVYPKPGTAGAAPATVSGLVPDGVDVVSIHNADGHVESTEVMNNGFQLSAGTLPATVKFRDAGDKQHTVAIDDLDEGLR